jgi:NADPH:quinone reductase-like Zn-dependent oxidoreductase
MSAATVAPAAAPHATAGPSYRLADGAAVLAAPAHAAAPPPPLGPSQVRLRLEAASLNYRDLLCLGDAAQAGLAPLSDGAGVVTEVGGAVAEWKVGDRVLPSFFPDWAGGRFSAAAAARALGGGGVSGVLASGLVVDAAALVAAPAHLTAVEAATLPCAGLTAWHALFERGRLRAGETVLAHGTGGVALFGLQRAVAQGAKVIITSSSDAKLARARALGAWKTINYKATPEWDKEALAATDGKGVDHILELGGPDTYDRSIAAVAHGGSIYQIGVLSGFTHQPNILPLQFKNATVHGICVGSVEQFRRLNAFLTQHAIHPVIDRTFSFADAPKAYEYLRGATHFGKVVITV